MWTTELHGRSGPRPRPRRTNAPKRARSFVSSSRRVVRANRRHIAIRARSTGRCSFGSKASFVPSFEVWRGSVCPPAVCVLLARRALREVRSNGLRLRGGEHPSGVLVLGCPREVRAEVCANELPGNVQLVRESLRTNILDTGHNGLPSFARALRAFAVDRVYMRTNAYVHMRCLGFVNIRERSRTLRRVSFAMRAFGHNGIVQSLCSSTIDIPPLLPTRGRNRGDVGPRGERSEAEPELLRRKETTSWQH